MLYARWLRDTRHFDAFKRFAFSNSYNKHVARILFPDGLHAAFNYVESEMRRDKDLIPHIYCKQRLLRFVTTAVRSTVDR